MMKQKVEVKIIFRDLSQTLNLMNVYQKGNTLIAVSNIEDTDNYSEPMCARKDSALVEISGNKELAVKHYIINPGGRKLELEKNYSEVTSFEKIREIAGLLPLPIERSDLRKGLTGSSAEWGLFSSSDDVDAEMDSSEYSIRPH